MNAAVETIIEDPPVIHMGGKISWAISHGSVRFIAETAKDGWNTLETGCGASTAVFAALGCNHYCLTPATDEIERIKTYLADKEISADRVNFICGRSEDLLPALDSEPLDLVLIDGNHEFPNVQTDFFYTARRMKTGGYMLIDDTQLWPCWIMMKFLAVQPNWQFVEEIGGKLAIFKKLGEPERPGHMHQPYNMKQNRRMKLYARFREVRARLRQLI